MNPTTTRPQGPPLRVLIVEDEPFVRRGLALRLAAEDDLEVIATAPDAESGIELARALRPDLVLLDARLPHMDGLQAAAALTVEMPSTPIVVLSLFDDTASRDAALAAGARRFVSKHDGDLALLESIRASARRLDHHATGSGCRPADAPPPEGRDGSHPTP